MSVVAKLRREIEQRFPAVYATLDDEDEAFILMHRIVEWLRSAPRQAITPGVVQQLREFITWCEAQPRSELAENDIFTIYIIGFLEYMFEAESTRILIPQLVPRADVEDNAGYLKSWVGEENYQRALDEYDRSV